MCDVTRLCVQRDSDAFLYTTWLVYVCDMTPTPSNGRRDLFFGCDRLGRLHMCDMTRVCRRHNSFICVA